MLASLSDVPNNLFMVDPPSYFRLIPAHSSATARIRSGGTQLPIWFITSVQSAPKSNWSGNPPRRAYSAELSRRG